VPQGFWCRTVATGTGWLRLSTASDGLETAWAPGEQRLFRYLIFCRCRRMETERSLDMGSKGGSEQRKEWRNQFAFLASHAIEAARIQYRRIESGAAEARHDLDFYMLCLWRLREIAEQTASSKRGLSEVVQPLLNEFDERVPRENLKALRNWWLHPQHGQGTKLHNEWVSWFSDSIVNLRAGGRVEYIVHVGMQEAAERLYSDLINLLEPATSGL
jgi:hypothetical protein